MKEKWLLISELKEKCKFFSFLKKKFVMKKLASMLIQSTSQILYIVQNRILKLKTNITVFTVSLNEVKLIFVCLFLLVKSGVTEISTVYENCPVHVANSVCGNSPEEFHGPSILHRIQFI